MFLLSYVTVSLFLSSSENEERKLPTMKFKRTEKTQAFPVLSFRCFFFRRSVHSPPQSSSSTDYGASELLGISVYNTQLVLLLKEAVIWIGPSSVKHEKQ